MDKYKVGIYLPYNNMLCIKPNYYMYIYIYNLPIDWKCGEIKILQQLKFIIYNAIIQ